VKQFFFADKANILSFISRATIPKKIYPPKALPVATFLRKHWLRMKEKA
jgi:hypothetical protein